MSSTPNEEKKLTADLSVLEDRGAEEEGAALIEAATWPLEKQEEETRIGMMREREERREVGSWLFKKKKV